MKILFFDTETTGVPRNYNAPSTDTDNWPRMVQLGYIIYDLNRNVIKKEDYIIKPDNYIIPDASYQIHKISTEYAKQVGVDLKTVLNRFEEDLKDIDLIVGHNIDFDIKVVDSEFYRCFNKTLLKDFDKICTMHSSIDFCDLPNRKWPKLEELHFKLFGESFSGAHDAMTDVKVTAKCFWKLVDLNVVKIKNPNLKISRDSLSIESIAEFAALGKLRYKLRQTNLFDRIEEQLPFLYKIFESNDNNLLKTELTEMQMSFLHEKYNNIIKRYNELFKDDNTDDKKHLKITYLSHLGYFWGLSENRGYREMVINKYYSLVPEYERFCYEYIVTNEKYEYTVNPKDVFARVASLHKKHRVFCEGMNFSNTIEKTVQFVKEYTPIIKQVRNDGLDDFTYEVILNNFFMGKFKAIEFLLDDEKISRLEFEGINDFDSLVDAVKAIDLIYSELELPEDILIKASNYSTRFQNEMQYTSKANSGCGCILLLPLILSGLGGMTFMLFLVINYII